ncbi:hypothetical protein PTKIN_Ptkin18bG0025700 [Pterospermum kingtungense]
MLQNILLLLLALEHALLGLFVKDPFSQNRLLVFVWCDIQFCRDICSRPWDVTCFIEHLCVSNLVKLLIIFGRCFIIMIFLYPLFKLGICQCITRSLCKICWAGCEAYWFALEDMTCFLWHKLKNTKRVNRRRRFEDIEAGYNLSNGSDYSDNYCRRPIWF